MRLVTYFQRNTRASKELELEISRYHIIKVFDKSIRPRLSSIKHHTSELVAAIVIATSAVIVASTSASIIVAITSAAAIAATLVESKSENKRRNRDRCRNSAEEGRM